jgi:hypothetical protein
MKKLNMLLMFAMLITAGFLSSCQKDEAVKEVNKVTGDLKVVFNCDQCVETWTDTQVTYGPSYFDPQGTSVPALENVYLDVWNDETTVYYHIYRLNGATFNHLAVGMNDDLTVIITDGDAPLTEYSWTTPLTEGWEACDVVGCIAIIIGDLSKPLGGINHAHYNFCEEYLLRDICDDVEVECSAETAWAAGPRYTLQGNWATYTPYVAGSTVDIYAGQNIMIGTANFSAVVNGEVTIEIVLINESEFSDVPESLKIQDYANAPSGNPAPGQFDWKWNATGSTWTAVVPANNYYGIHIDAIACVPIE